MPKSDARDRVLDAAERIVVDQGARNLTLESVAAGAGVSKGGLLYHFPTKEALLQAMVDRRCSGLDVQIREHMAADGGPMDALAAYVSVALERSASARLGGPLIAAIANDPRLLDPVRTHRRGWLVRLDPAAPGFADRAVVWLAVEGLSLLELLELSPLNQEQRHDIADRLSELVRGGDLALAVSKAPAKRRRSARPKSRRREAAVESK